MNRAGKASPLVVIGIVCVVMLVGVIFFLQGAESPATRANAFLIALGQGDVDGILSTSTFGDEPVESVRKKWEKTVHRAEFYRFHWDIKGTANASEEEANVAVDMYKHADNPNTTSARVQIPMIKIDGKWYVDAKSLNRDMYPALPR
jgi:hypothetical protein